MATNTKLDSLVINYLTQSQYDTAKNNGTLNANQIYMTPASSTSYTLPTATSSTLGGVKIGSNITVSSGTISLTKANVTNALGYTPPTTDTKYTLPNATSSVLGGVKIGSNITVSSGTISLTKANVTSALGYTPPTTDTKYTLPTADASTLGGVKLSDDYSTESNSSEGVAATPSAVLNAYNSCVKLRELTSTSMFNYISIESMVGSIGFFVKGRTAFLTVYGTGAATSGASGFIQIGVVKSPYKPTTDMYCAVTINGTTNGQIFYPATCVIKSTGEIQIITGKVNTTFGNSTYPWSTKNVMCIKWDY